MNVVLLFLQQFLEQILRNQAKKAHQFPLRRQYRMKAIIAILFRLRPRKVSSRDLLKMEWISKCATFYKVAKKRNKFDFSLGLKKITYFEREKFCAYYLFTSIMYYTSSEKAFVSVDIGKKVLISIYSQDEKVSFFQLLLKFF